MIDLSGVGTNQKKSDRQKERKHPSVNKEISDKENITSSSCHSIKMNFDISKNQGSAVMPKQFSGAMPESFPKSTVRTPHIMSYGEGQLRTLVQQDQNVTIRNPENLHIEKCIEDLSLTDQIKEAISL